MNHPVLFFLPIVVSFVLHIVISMGLIMEAGAGFYRFFIYYASAAFLVVYLLMFNQGVTLATTRVVIDYPGKNIYLENQYGSVRVPAGNIKGVIVEKQKNQYETVWVISHEQTFYIDRKFSGFINFLPALEALVDLDEPRYAGDALIYPTRHTPKNTSLEITRKDNTLKGDTLYYLPWILVMPFFSYKLGIKTWLGTNRYLLLYILTYGLPIMLLSFIFHLSLTIGIFLIFYPVYLLFLSAACIPEHINIDWLKKG
jgi:hypothetical protein